MCNLGGLFFFIAQVKFSPNVLSFASTDGQIHSENYEFLYLI